MLRKVSVFMTIVLGLSLLLAACAAPTPITVVETVEVPVEVPGPKETVVVVETVEVPVEVPGPKETVVVVQTVEVPVPVVPAGSVIVFGTWSGDELDAFNAMLAPFTEETGISVAFLGTRDLPAVVTTRVEAGNPPDVAIMPNPGQVAELAELGALVDLATFMDTDQLEADYGQSWLDISSYEGTLISLFFKPAYKSLVWYNPGAFDAAGYEVPTTWDGMTALSDQIVADGGVPWCVGFESAEASGWPGTDWVEDIMLRTAGPDVYDQWVNHEIPWTDPAVKTGWETMGGIVANQSYVFGGTTGVLTINFGDSPAPLFDDPPGCYLHRQASFIPAFFPEGAVAGEDYAFFPLPSIDPAYGTPALTSGDFLVMFNDTPQARALLEYLVSLDAQDLAVSSWGGYISAHKGVNTDLYPDDLTRQIGEALVSAEVARFDGGDVMPAAVGSGSFWTGILDYVGGVDLDTVLATIEASAVDAY